MENKLSYSLDEREGLRILHLSGSISNVTRAEFGKLVDVLTQKSSIIIDMSKVLVVTSSGLSTLVDVCVNARVRGRRVLVMGVKPDLIAMIEQLDMYEYFIFVESVEEGERKIKYYT